jgi:hypothetical protein
LSLLRNSELEKDLETWDYFLANEFVYGGEPIGRKEVVKGGYLERYLNSDLKLSCVIWYVNVYYVIIAQALDEAIYVRPITNLKDGV